MKSESLKRVYQTLDIKAKIGLECNNRASIKMLIHKVSAIGSTMDIVLIYEDQDDVRIDMKKHVDACLKKLKIALYECYIHDGFDQSFAQLMSETA